jgi:diguanylate cyclase (GGDEF)-like protein
VKPDQDDRERQIVNDLPPPRRVLIASNDRATLTWGQRWLDRVGFEVESARDTADALNKVEAGGFGLVILDDELTHSSGESVCRELRKIPVAHDLPVLTLCSGSQQALRSLECGSTDVVVRPYDWRVLIRRADLLYKAHETRQACHRAQVRLHAAQQTAESSRKRMQHLTTHDQLTGLPNRVAFQQMLESTVEAYDHVAVMSIGLDRFQMVNRVHGRATGDRILQQVARRLSRSVRSDDRMARASTGPTAGLARWSGDDFAMMFGNIQRLEHVMVIAERLNRALSDPFTVGGKEVFLSASIGAAMSPDDGEDAETLLRHAESAMKDAKRHGGGLIRIGRDLGDEGDERKLRIGRHLRGAIDRDELEVHYQPLVNLDTQQVVGAEALLRWEHPELGRVSPAEFVPLAEEAGLIDGIGRWVLSTACRQLRAWQDEGLSPIRISVNISAQQLLRGDLAEVVADALRETGVDGKMLELELSERGALRADRSTLGQLAALKEMGVRLSVDDFGTGNSAIAYLRRFPLDALKIDRSYVKGIELSENDAAITSAMIAMAHKLRLVVVAEGVEEAGQLEFLRECQCDQYQGYLFSAALPANRFREMLAGSRQPAELLN